MASAETSKSQPQSNSKPKAKAGKKKAASRLADARARMYHDLIFDAAESVFGRHGYDKASMQEISEEAGVSLKTVYATFESKQELFDDITEVRATAFYAAIAEALEGDDDPRERLARATLAYATYLFEHEDWLRIHLHGRIAWAFRPKDPKTAARWDLGRETFSKLLRDGMEQGVFYDGDPDELALLVQTVMQVVVGRAMLAGETDADTVAGDILLQVGRMLGVQAQ
jgi:AcrR family transcriptional regulator